MIDFNKLLTEQDLKEIENMPEPSQAQAEHIYDSWKRNSKHIDAHDSTQVFNAMIYYKLLMKVKSVYPELFV